MSVFKDDGVSNDYGWASQWNDSQARAAGAQRYSTKQSYQDFNDLEILSSARIVGGSPDNPGCLRVSYHAAHFGEFLGDVSDWDDPQQKIGFCDAVRSFVKGKTTNRTNTNREELSERNRAVNEGRQTWSNDPMQLLGPNGAPIQAGAPLHTPVQPSVAGGDPVQALQQQLTQSWQSLAQQEQQYTEALSQIQIQKATVEQQLNAINAAANAVAPPTQPASFVPTAPVPVAPPPAPVATPVVDAPQVIQSPVSLPVTTEETVSDQAPEETPSAVEPPPSLDPDAITLPDGI